MAYWTAAFLMIALAAGIMGAGGFAGISVLAASGLFMAGVVLSLFPLVLERRDQAGESTSRRPGEPG